MPVKKYNTDEERKAARKMVMKRYYEKNKSVILENAKTYYQDNKDVVCERTKKYRDCNKEIVAEKNKMYNELNKASIKERKKKYRNQNKEKIQKYKSEYYKNRLITDPLFRLTKNIRNSINNAFYNNSLKKNGRTEKILGCTFDEFKLHIESQFESWMSWDNQALWNGELNYGWDLDHIIPISSVLIEDDIIRLNHYTNFRPLCSHTNRYIKRNNI